MTPGREILVKERPRLVLLVRTHLDSLGLGHGGHRGLGGVHVVRGGAEKNIRVMGGREGGKRGRDGRPMVGRGQVFIYSRRGSGGAWSATATFNQYMP